jgi:uncharacterized membrane protein
MVVFQEAQAGRYRFTLRPNCAMSWRRTKALMLCFAGCLVAVGGYFAARGAWLVLPFAGLELIVLCAGFYLSALAGKTREVVEVDANTLRVLRGGGRLQEVATLSRHWTRVALLRDPRGWHPSQLVLHCHGRSVELRTRLLEAEREELAKALHSVVGISGCFSGADSAGVCGPRPIPRSVGGYREGEAQVMSRIGLQRPGAQRTAPRAPDRSNTRGERWQ